MKKKIIISIVILLVAVFIGYRAMSTKQNKPQYQTAAVEKGTLVESAGASGNITQSGSVNVTTQTSGTVKEVLVKNGDQVERGQVIARLSLDQVSLQKQTAALSSLQNAQTTLDGANANLNTLQNTLFVTNQKFINDAVARGLLTTDPTYIEEYASWLAAEANYKNQQTVITQAQTALNSAALSYQQTSSTVIAPISGTISGLTIAVGSPISAVTSTSTPVVVASVNQGGSTLAAVDLSEIDSVNVSPNQKATMTIDAFPNKTFTGRVVNINTNGVVSSGVTTYPAIISFDTPVDHLYPNMAVSAKIITKVKDNVLLIPSSAVQSQNGQSVVRILKNGQPTQVPVETGDSNDTQTEIVSGLSENDQVVTGTASRQGSQGQSPFGQNRGGFGAFRAIGGGR